jgi:hypothetical protein
MSEKSVFAVVIFGLVSRGDIVPCMDQTKPSKSSNSHPTDPLNDFMKQQPQNSPFNASLRWLPLIWVAEKLKMI